MIRKSIPFIFALAFGLIGFSAYTLLSQSPPSPPTSEENSQNINISIEQQKKSIIQYINESNSISAKAALEKLIDDYGNTDAVVPAVYDIAEKYREKRNYWSARSAYKYIVDNFPLNAQAVFAKRGILISDIAIENLTEAKIELEKLLTNYSSEPNISQAVFEVADAYYWFKYYKEANQLYQKVIDNYPSSDYAMWAQMGLAISYIADSNDKAALEATDKLAANYASNEKLPEALTYIAGRYVWSKRYDKGLDIYSNIINKFPQSTWAEGAKFESAKVGVYTFIDANDEPNTLIAIESLINDFNDKPELPGVIYEFASRVDSQNWYEPNSLIKSIYQRIVDKFPDNPIAKKAQLSIARLNVTSLINSGDDANAFTNIDKLISDFNGLPDLPVEIDHIAQKCYNDGLRMFHKGKLDKSSENYQKSIKVHEIIIKKLPYSDLTPISYYFAAVLYSDYLKQYQKGIDYFQKIVDTWPDFEFTWNAQYFIGFYYKILRDSGNLSPSEANPKIEQAYETFINKYSNNDLVPFAALELGHIKFMKNQ